MYNKPILTMLTLIIVIGAYGLLIAADNSLWPLEKNPVSNMISGSDKDRAAIGVKLYLLKKDVLENLHSVVVNDNSNRFNGPKATALRLLGNWREADTIKVLSDCIDFKIDKNTIPDGLKVPVWIIYPSAISLTKIGGRDVRDMMIFHIISCDDTLKLKLYSWVLYSTEGEKAAKWFLTNALEGVTNIKVKNRIEQAIEYIKKGDLIFNDK